MKLKKNQFNKMHKKNIKNKDQIEKKNSIFQIEIEWWNWKQIKVLQKDLKQNLENKRIRIEVKISINKRTTLKFCKVKMNFKKKREKSIISDKTCSKKPQA